MIVNLINVFLHLGGKRGRDFAATGFASYMRCVGIELRLEIDQNRTTRRELLICNGALKFGVSFIHFCIERRAIETFFGNGELVDKRKMKTAQAFDLRVASGFGKGRGAATRNDDRGSAQEKVSNVGIHKPPSFIDLVATRSRLSRHQDAPSSLIAIP
jgi:hypothetical protein